MPFELRVDFAGLIAFISNTKDPEDATFWNAVLVDPTMGGHVDEEQHFPMLVVPVECFVDDLPDDLVYRTVPPINGVEMIGLSLDRLIVSFDPLQTGLKSYVDLVADLERAVGDTKPGTGKV